MHSRPFGREHIPRSMDSEQACDLKTGCNAVLNQSVRKIECQSRRTQDTGGAGGLTLTGSPARVPGWFTIAQVDEKCRQPLVRQLRDRPAHRDFQIIGMGAKREHVKSLIHSSSLVFCAPTVERARGLARRSAKDVPEAARRAGANRGEPSRA